MLCERIVTFDCWALRLDIYCTQRRAALKRTEDANIFLENSYFLHISKNQLRRAKT